MVPAEQGKGEGRRRGSVWHLFADAMSQACYSSGVLKEQHWPSHETQSMPHCRTVSLPMTQPVRVIVVVNLAKGIINANSAILGLCLLSRTGGHNFGPHIALSSLSEWWSSATGFYLTHYALLS